MGSIRRTVCIRTFTKAKATSPRARAGARSKSRRSIRAALAVVLATTLALAACGGADTASESSESGSYAEPGSSGDAGGRGGEAAQRPPAGSAGEGGAGDIGVDESGDGDTGVSDGSAGEERGAASAADTDAASAADIDGVVSAQVLAEGRDIVYLAEAVVRVEDVTTAAASARDLAASAQGYVFAEETRHDPDDEGVAEARLTLKVPPVAFEATMSSLAGLGEALSQTRSSEDVTAEVTDLDARIATHRAVIERIRGYLAADDQDLADVLRIESELTGRQADLDSLLAQRERLGNLTALSTIVATFVGPDAAPPPSVEEDPELGFLAGLENGWGAFVDVTLVGMTVVGALLPFAAAGAVVAVPLLLLLRGRRQRLTPGPATGTGTPPPSTP
jgi:hypothetical protein